MPAALHPETKSKRHWYRIGRNSDGAQILTVQARLLAGGRNVWATDLCETSNALLQLLTVLVRAEAVDSGATVQIAHGARTVTFTLHNIRGQYLAIARIFMGLTHLVRDDIWVDDLGSSDQRGVDSVERRALLEMASGDCGQGPVGKLLARRI